MDFDGKCTAVQTLHFFCFLLVLPSFVLWTVLHSCLLTARITEFLFSLNYSFTIVYCTFEWDPKAVLFYQSCFPLSLSFSPSITLLGWASEGQHGEADILRPVSSREAGPYRSVPVWEVVKRCGSAQIRVSITSQLPHKMVWKNNFSINFEPFILCHTLIHLI